MSNKFSPSRSPKKTFNFSLSEAQPRSTSTLNKRLLDRSVSNLVDKSYSMQSLDELEFYRLKCIELESQLQKVSELPVDVYRENSGLHMELEKLQKQYAQKRNEAELWKQKYENQLSQLMQVKANYELQIQQLSHEVQSLLQKSDEFEYDKLLQIEDARSYIESSQHAQTETMKKTFFQQNEMMEHQVRKLREQVNEKDNSIDDIQNKLERLRSDDENEMQRHLRDNENLRHKMNLIEQDRQKELEHLRTKLEGYSHQTLDNLRKTHMNSVEVLESEIDKLRALLEIKNAEIETLIQQNNKLKQNYESQITEVRLEVECLKQKLLDGERTHRTQMQALQNHMQDEQEHDLEQVNTNFERNLGTLQQEIRTLQSIINTKNEEFQQQLVDKTNLRTYFENQISDINDELEEHKQQQFITEREKDHEIQSLEDEIQRTRIQTQEQKDQLKAQVIFLEAEIQRLKDLAHQKNKDSESQINQFVSVRKTLDDDLKGLKHENDLLRQKLYDFERSRIAEFEELKVRVQTQDQFFREKSRQYEIKIESLIMELKRAKENNDIRFSDMENISQAKLFHERDSRKSKEENDSLKSKIINNERDKVHELEDLRQKLDASSLYQIENLKTAFNTQLNIMHSENQDFISTIHNKNREIQDLLDKFQSLEQAISTGQFGPEVIANRSIYDVYVRTKQRMPSSQKK